ncbi:hypothetical protein A3I35_03415 [Candidatus Falkowbacteria bacterium RIFCSPLOWO2_02_FULL_45_15]|uniref:Methyltransferase domain-containing protein n=1 Tax=Candidatus Falkowbacteria bacterium RIFCSPLOWO2_02_FULL_45_15 TaxID=1797988 RepID=A0A1F5RYG3_9BACT|nr:MAG: hypothetical protein A3I35_03415 [Candidatus Falkowbacteria bacterium RIFCSPLOWO2_02_FULL_45_15]
MENQMTGTDESRVVDLPSMPTSTKRDIPIIFDHKVDLNYESKSRLDSFRLWLMGLLVFIVKWKKKWIPESWPWFWKDKDKDGKRVLRCNSVLFDGLSRPCRNIRAGAASWWALDIIYNFDFRWFGALRLFSYFWITMRNARAVRNRKKMIVQHLVNAMQETFRQFGEVKILTLACGSAEAIFEACHIIVKDYPSIGQRLSVFFTDIDPKALRHVNIRIDEEKLGFICKAKKANILNFQHLVDYLIKIASFEPTMVEMVGLMDYLDDERAISLCHSIRDFLPVGGFFITANAISNDEVSFMSTVIEWDMIYREPEELASIIEAAGFNSKTSSCQIVVEPEKIHAVALCTV